MISSAVRSSLLLFWTSSSGPPPPRNEPLLPSLFFFLSSSLFLPGFDAAALSSLSFFRLVSISGVMTHRSIFFSKAASASPPASELPSDFELAESLSDPLSEPLELLEPLSESLSESLDELSESSEDDFAAGPASLSESLPSSSLSNSSLSNAFGFSLKRSISSWKALFPLRTLARSVLNAFCLLSVSFSPLFCFFSWRSVCVLSVYSSSWQMAFTN
mmetsp:Transcript_100146/g.283468  ORF Transcript_100146/g.283468 Transcript_100146/m.283468 type:complete len:217 (+) Transcript_100146:2075-2725(+)